MDQIISITKKSDFLYFGRKSIENLVTAKIFILKKTKTVNN